MSHSVEEAREFITRLLTAHHEEDTEAFQAIYAEALATSDPARPMFWIVNLLIDALVTGVTEKVAGEWSAADALLRDALADIPDPGFPADEGDPK